jgi:predicted RND superfamily exporter protein
MLERYGHWVIRWRYWIVLVTLMVTFAAASGARFLEFTTDYRAFFSATNPQLLAFEELQNTYTKNDNIMFVLAPKDGEVFERETLAALEWITEQAWQIPYSIRVDSITNFQHTRADEDELIVEDLVSDALNLSDEQIAYIETVALQEPLLIHRLISAQAHVTAVNVTVQLPGENRQNEVPEAVIFARDLADQIRQRYTGLEVHLTGIVVMNLSFEEASKGDLTSLVPAMYVVILVALGFLLRGFTGTFATLLLITFSIVGAMGLAGWAGIQLTGPSASSPTIILTLAVADSVHFLSTMLHGMRSKGLTRHQAIVESLRVNFSPIFLTSLTTAIGFLTMNFGEVPPFADMGNIVATGVGLAFVWSVTFLPAAMAILPVRARQGQTSFGNNTMERLAEFVVRRRRSLMWGMGILIIALLAFIPRNQLNDVFVHYFDESFEFRRATDFLTENLTGLYDVHYSLDSGQPSGLSQPEFLARVEAFANWYREQPHVIHVNVITDVFKRLNKNLHGDDESYYRLPDQRDLAAQYLLLYEMSLPYGLDLNNQINVDKSGTRLSVTLETISTNDMLALEQRAQQWLSENGLPAMQTAGSSTTIMFANIGYRNIRAMLSAAVVALVLISIILIVALRSWKYGLISLIPNLIPVGVGFGIWGLVDGQIGLALSVVAGVTLGIVVDDTIHFMSKYLRALREQRLSPPDAVRYAFRSVGVALLVTTIVLAIGFFVLSFSHFKVNADMGIMTALTIIIALIVDFLFLPPLLIKLEQKTQPTDVKELEEQPA